MRTIANPERGCGRLHAGGYYAQGIGSAYGSLIDAWCLATCIQDEFNLFVTPVNKRQLELINLPATLEMGNVRLPSDPTIELTRPALKGLPRYALLDHVGTKFYTPYQFAQEVFAHGPSRRIPEHVAAQIAPYTPMPIVFTHSQIPLLTIEGIASIAALTSTFDNISGDSLATARVCSWHDPKWGLYIGNHNGSDHWSLPVLKYEADNLLLPFPHHEQIFFISWINRIVYIASENDDQDKIERLTKKGIEPVVAALADEVKQ